MPILTTEVPNYVILTHPNIPKALHGLNPRSLLGQEWWDNQRHAAYRKYGYRCWACGMPKGSDPFKPWLEGHESYQYDYRKGTARLVEVVALCHSCHSFIHSGRLWALYKAGEVSHMQIKHIIDTRMEMLQKAGLKPFPATMQIWVVLTDDLELRDIRAGMYLKRQKEATPHTNVRWEDWRLILYGHQYKPIIKNMEEWERKYGPR